MSAAALHTVTRRGAGVAGHWCVVDSDGGRGLELGNGTVVLMPWLGAPALQERLPDVAGAGVVAVIGEEPSHYIVEVAAGVEAVTLRELTGGDYAIRLFDADAASVSEPETRFVAGGDVSLNVQAIGGHLRFLLLTRTSL